jgi:hypothetical protein
MFNYVSTFNACRTPNVSNTARKMLTFIIQICGISKAIVMSDKESNTAGRIASP